MPVVMDPAEKPNIVIGSNFNKTRTGTGIWLLIPGVGRLLKIREHVLYLVRAFSLVRGAVRVLLLTRAVVRIYLPGEVESISKESVDEQLADMKCDHRDRDAFK